MEENSEGTIERKSSSTRVFYEKVFICLIASSKFSSSSFFFCSAAAVVFDGMVISMLNFKLDAQ